MLRKIEKLADKKQIKFEFVCGTYIVPEQKMSFSARFGVYICNLSIYKTPAFYNSGIRGFKMPREKFVP